jgi:Reverse transcriptase (RNA-dependent DNA polymerase)/Endonuclease-reverse transcriptase
VWNVEGARTLLKKLPGINVFKNLDILVFTETFSKVNYDIRHFYSAHSRATQGVGGRPSGGISCFSNPKLGPIINSISNSSYLIVNLKSICIICFYLNPSLSLIDVHEIVLEAFCQAQGNTPIVLTGDFNCRMDVSNNEKGISLIEVMSDLNCILCNDPMAKTYICHNGSSTIDLLFIDPSKFILISHHFPKFAGAHLRKHQPIVFNIKFLHNVQSINFPTTPLSNITNKIDQEKLHNLIQENFNLLNSLFATCDIDKIYDKMQYLILNSAVPKKCSERQAKPWFDKEAFISRKLVLDTLFKLRICSFQDKQLLSYFAVVKKDYVNLLNVKRDLFQTKFEENLVSIAENTPYTYLKKDKILRVQCPIPVYKWENHFKEILNCNNMSSDDSLNLISLIDEYTSDVIFEPISTCEINSILNSMKNNKAAGPDFISKEHIATLGLNSGSCIATFFKLCIENKKLPKIWKQSLLTVLYKGKGDILSTNSYRGIANCYIMLKLFDKFICKRVFHFTKTLIPETQFGFMPGRSTIHAVKYLHTQILKDVAEPRSFTYVLFIDFLKAFDMVDRKLLLCKLMETKKLPKELLVALALLLEINFVTVNDGLLLSEPILQSNGVLQGSPCSPLLYNLLTSDVATILESVVDLFTDNPEVLLSIYADDMAIQCKNLAKLQKVLDKLIEWASLTGLKINANKTKIMKFKYASGGRPRANPLPEDIYCNGTKLEFVKSFKYLGITFQQTGKSFAAHVKDRSKSAITASFSITNLHLLSLKTAIKLFHLKVSPVASYGIEIFWQYLTITDFTVLESVKSRFLKRALCLSKFTKSRLVYELTGEKFFVTELQSKFNLPMTENYKKFVNNRESKAEDINLSFYNTPAFKNDNWKNPIQKNRNVITRFAVHGFHHTICKTKDYHNCNDDCTCTLCGLKCDQYHLLSCSKRQLSLCHYAEGKDAH